MVVGRKLVAGDFVARIYTRMKGRAVVRARMTACEDRSSCDYAGGGWAHLRSPSTRNSIIWKLNENTFHYSVFFSNSESLLGEFFIAFEP